MRWPAVQGRKRIVLAVLLVAIATAATWAMWPNLEPSITPLFLAAVTISAWLGGIRSGLVAAVLSALASIILSKTLGWHGQLGFASATWTASYLLVGLLTGALTSARRNAEQLLIDRDQRMRLVSDQLPAGLWSTDRELRLTSMFGAGLPIVGSTEEAVNLSDVFHSAAGGDVAEEAHRKALSGRAETYEIELDGVVYQCHLEPLHNPQGQIIGVVGVSLDITARKRAEEQLKQARDEAAQLKQQAEAANKAKDRFLAMLSHELRTPLTPALIAAASLEQDADLPAELREDVTMIRRNIELEAILIDDLLDLTRVARGKLQLHLQPTHVNDVLERAIEICEPDIDEKQIEIVRDFSAVENVVVADPPRLQQVFWNLIKNAVKFTPIGGRVTVRTRNKSENNSHNSAKLIVEVIDTGIGIEPHLLPKVFDAFEQGSQSITRAFGGLGLGLAITKKLVEAHHGHVYAESGGRGRGATFRVEIQTVHSPAEWLEPEEPSDTLRSRKAVKILLVEDHADTRRLMSRILGRLGHDVRTAESVAGALKAFDNHPVDLLLSDLSLPDGSGIDLMRQLRESHQGRIKGIALSGFGMEDDVRQCSEAGFATHLTKPVNLDVLEEAIQQVAKS